MLSTSSASHHTPYREQSLCCDLTTSIVIATIAVALVVFAILFLSGAFSKDIFTADPHCLSPSTEYIIILAGGILLLAPPIICLSTAC